MCALTPYRIVNEIISHVDAVGLSLVVYSTAIWCRRMFTPPPDLVVGNGSDRVRAWDEKENQQWMTHNSFRLAKVGS
jgi:hypothetical protein